MTVIAASDVQRGVTPVFQTVSHWVSRCRPDHPHTLVGTDTYRAVGHAFAAALHVFSTAYLYRSIAKSLINDAAQGFQDLEHALASSYIPKDPTLGGLLFLGLCCALVDTGDATLPSVPLNEIAQGIGLAKQRRGWWYPDMVLAMALRIWKDRDRTTQHLAISPRTLWRRVRQASPDSPLRSPSLQQLLMPAPTIQPANSTIVRRFPLGWGDSLWFDEALDDWIVLKATPHTTFFADHDIVRVELHPDDFQYSAVVGRRNVRYGRTADGRYVGQQMSWAGCTSACQFMILADLRGDARPQWLARGSGQFSHNVVRRLRFFGLSAHNRPLPPPTLTCHNYALLRPFLRHAVQNGPILFSTTNGHMMILDRIRSWNGTPVAFLRDPYHGWAIIVHEEALLRMLPYEYITVNPC